MIPRRQLVATLASALCAALVATTAFAAKPAPRSIPLDGQPIAKVAVGGSHLESACNLGVSTGAAYIVNYLLPPDDAYYTLLDPAQCGCAANAVQLNGAHLLLNFQAACDQPVRVRVVGAVTTAPGCLAPDPGTTLCGPVFYDLLPGAAGNFQFNLPLPAGCCVQSAVFLEIDFTTAGAGCDQYATRPRLITTATCDPCTSWNIFPGGEDDLCDPSLGLPGNPVMWADGACCAATPTEHGSWGRVKILYR